MSRWLYHRYPTEDKEAAKKNPPSGDDGTASKNHASKCVHYLDLRCVIAIGSQHLWYRRQTMPRIEHTHMDLFVSIPAADKPNIIVPVSNLHLFIRLLPTYILKLFSIQTVGGGNLINVLRLLPNEYSRGLACSVCRPPSQIQATACGKSIAP